LSEHDVNCYVGYYLHLVDKKQLVRSCPQGIWELLSN